MKALRWHGRKDLRFEDVPEPEPGPGEVKIKVSKAGICGTDLKEYASGPCIIDPGIVPGAVTHLIQDSLSGYTVSKAEYQRIENLMEGMSYVN